MTNVFDSLIESRLQGIADFLKAEADHYQIDPGKIAYLALVNQGRFLTALVKGRKVLRPLPLGNLALKVFGEEIEAEKLKRTIAKIRLLMSEKATELEVTENQILLVIRVEEDKPTIWLQQMDVRLEQIPTAQFGKLIYNA